MALLTRRRAISRCSPIACKDGTYPSVGARHPPAIRLERAIGRSVRPGGRRRARPAAVARSRLLGCAASAGAARAPRDAPAPYAFLPAEGEGLHQIPVGPVHAGIIEPGHFRFTANGETCGAAGAAARLCAQGHRVLMAGRHARQRGASSPAAPPATARSPMPLLCARRRSGVAVDGAAARHLSARADGGAGAARQSFRRHRRDLQRRLVRADACAVRHPARARPARGRCLLRPPADDGRHRARRRRARHRAGRRRAIARAARGNPQGVSAR